MTTNDDRASATVTERLRQSAERYEPQPDWAAVVQRMDRSVRRRRLFRDGSVAIAVAAASLVAVVFVVGQMGDGGGAGQRIVVGAADVPARLLPAEGGDSSYVLTSVHETTVGEDLGGLLVVAGYGPSGGDSSDGLIVWRGALGDIPVDPQSAAGPVSLPGELIDRDGRMVHRKMVAWDVGDVSYGVGWFGDTLSSDQALTLAASIATDPQNPVAQGELPVGWDWLYGLEDLPAGTGILRLFFDDEDNETFFTVISVGREVPPVMLDFTTLFEWEAIERRAVDVHGTPGLQVDWDADGVFTSSVGWREEGATFWLSVSSETGPPAESAIELAERLEVVDEARWEVYLDEFAVHERGSTADAAAPVTTTAFESATTTLDGVVITAPGPGELAGNSTIPAASTSTTTTTGVATTGEGETTQTPPEPGPEVFPPAGPWVEDRIVVVDEATLGATAYSIGVHWSSVFGLCIGVAFDASATEGGYPVNCELDPAIGGGGTTVHETAGSLVYAYTPAAIDRATLDLSDREHTARLLQVADFPELTFIVFVLPDADPAEIENLFVPGEIALWQDDAEVGWG